MEDVIQLAKRICPELLVELAREHPEYLIDYKMKCEEYLAGNYSNTQKLAAANSVISMAHRLGLLDITTPKTVTVCFRATQAEKELLKKQAAEKGMELSDFIRWRLGLS